MVWTVDGDLDEYVTLLRNDYEKKTGKSISKKDFLKKLVYENDNMRSILEVNGIKPKKDLLRLPKL